MVLADVKERIAISFETEGTGQVVSDMDSMTGHIFSFRGALLAAGAAMGFFSAKALASASGAAAEFETAMVELEKVTNAQTARVMGQEILDMASTFPVAQENLAGITAEAGRLGIRGTENLRRFTRVVGEMGVATNIAGNEAAKQFAKIIAQTNATAANVRGLGAAINELSNNIAADAGDITDAVGRSAAAMSTLGAQTDNILALGSVMAAFSDSARRGGSRLRRFAQELMDPRKIEKLASRFSLTEDQLREMRDTAPTDLMLQLAKQFDTNSEAAEELSRIFSTQTQFALAILGQNMDEVSQALGISQDQFANFGSLARETEKATDTFQKTIQQTRNLVHELSIQTGGFLNPILKDTFRLVNDGLRAFNDLNEEVGGTLSTFILVGGAVAGLAIAFQSAMTLMGISLSALTAQVAVASAPWIALAAVVGAAAAAYQTNALGVRDSTDRMVEDIASSMSRFTANVSGAIDGQKREFSEGKEAVRDWGLFTTDFLDMMGTGFAQFVDMWLTGTTMQIRATVGAASSIIRAFESVIEVLETFIDAIITAYQSGIEASNAFGTAVRQALDPTQNVDVQGFNRRLGEIQQNFSDFASRTGGQSFDPLKDFQEAGERNREMIRGLTEDWKNFNERRRQRREVLKMRIRDRNLRHAGVVPPENEFQNRLAENEKSMADFVEGMNTRLDNLGKNWRVTAQEASKKASSTQQSLKDFLLGPFEKVPLDCDDFEDKLNVEPDVDGGEIESNIGTTGDVGRENTDEVQTSGGPEPEPTIPGVTSNPQGAVGPDSISIHMDGNKVGLAIDDAQERYQEARRVFQ